MLKRSRCLLVGLLVLSFFTVGARPAQAAENPVKDVTLTRLAPHVWMHTSTGIVDGSPVPANGVVLESSKGLVLIDTPWNDSLTDHLLQQLKQQFPDKQVTDAIVTHAHDDRIGGLNTLYKNGVKVHSTKLTADLAEQRGFDRPLGDLKKAAKMRFGDIDVETYYPGKGHTKDNIIVWLPEDKLLFGGCLIKALETQEIVPTPDFYPDHWPHAVENVIKRYNDINIVVPGHGNPGDDRLLTHTLSLLENQK